MNGFWLGVGALVPSVGIGLIFWYVLRVVIQADRRERNALAELDEEERRARESGD